MVGKEERSHIYIVRVLWYCTAYSEMLFNVYKNLTEADTASNASKNFFTPTSNMKRTTLVQVYDNLKLQMVLELEYSKCKATHLGICNSRPCGEFKHFPYYVKSSRYLPHKKQNVYRVDCNVKASGCLVPLLHCRYKRSRCRP